MALLVALRVALAESTLPANLLALERTLPPAVDPAGATGLLCLSTANRGREATSCCPTLLIKYFRTAREKFISALVTEDYYACALQKFCDSLYRRLFYWDSLYFLTRFAVLSETIYIVYRSMSPPWSLKITTHAVVSAV